jgi:hypothetical protein
MQSIGDLLPDGGFALLIQGPPKTGKTMLALQFPGVWVADCANNMSGAVKMLLAQQPEHAKRVKWTNVNKSASGVNLEPQAKWPRLIEATNEALRDPEVKTILVDDLSFIDIFLQDFIVSEKADSKSKEMTISDWNPYKRLLTKFVTMIRNNTSRTLIFTAHEENAKDERTGSIFTRVNIPGKLADNLAGFFSDCWRTEIDTDVNGNPVYTVRAQPTTQIPQVGNSLGLPPRFKSTWADIQVAVSKMAKAPAVMPNS